MNIFKNQNNEDIEIDEGIQEQFLEKVGIQLFDGNLIINPLYEQDIQKIFGIEDGFTEQKRQDLIREMLAHQQGEDLLVRLIFAQKSITSLLYKYSLVEPELLAQELLYVLQQEQDSLFQHEISIPKLTKLLKIIKRSIFVINAAKVRRDREFSDHDQDDDGMSQVLKEGVKQIQIVLEKVKSIYTFFQIYIYFTTEAQIFKSIPDYIDEFHGVQIRLQNNLQSQDILTIFEHILIEPQELGINNQQQQQWNIKQQDFLFKLSKLSSIYQQATLYFINAAANKQPIKFDESQDQLVIFFRIIYYIDTQLLEDPADINTIKIMTDEIVSVQIQECEILKLYISERFSYLKLQQQSLFILSSINIDWNDQSYSNIIISILLRCNQYLQCYLYVSSQSVINEPKFEQIFTHFLGKCLQLGFRNDLFKTELSQQEESFLVKFLETIQREDLVINLQHLIAYLIKRQKIDEAIEQFMKLKDYEMISKEDQLRYIQTKRLIQDAINEQTQYEQRSYRQRYQNLWEDFNIEIDEEANSDLDFIQIVTQIKNQCQKKENLQGDFSQINPKPSYHSSTNMSQNKR